MRAFECFLLGLAAQIEIIESVFSDLPRTDPLSAKHEEEYTYLNDTRRAIGLLKQAGLTPDAFEALIDENAEELPKINAGLTKVFGARLSKRSVADAASMSHTAAMYRLMRSLYDTRCISLSVESKTDMCPGTRREGSPGVSVPCGSIGVNYRIAARGARPRAWTCRRLRS